MRAVIRNWIFAGGAVLLLAGCGGGDAFTSGEGGVDPNEQNSATANSLSLGTTQTSVRSNNSDSATITATVLDENRAVVEGAGVSFSTTAGQLTVASGVTDSTGTVITKFSSGDADPTNTTATITASVTGVADAVMPIQINGSYVDIVDLASTSMVIGGAKTLTVKAYDAGGQMVTETPVSVALSGTGTGTLSQVAGETDSQGLFETDFTASTAGAVMVIATALGDTDSVTLNIQGDTDAIQITNPAVNPSVLGVGTDLSVEVATPATTSTVTFATSLGGWVECGGANHCIRPVAAQTASATLNSTVSGQATVQVVDKDNADLTDETTVKIVVTEVDATSTVDLQADMTTVAVSTAAQTNSTTLRAYVGSNLSPIANATVVFSLTNTTGGGESVSPALAFTDADGYANTTFTSGANTTGAGGVLVTATIYDSSGIPVDSDSLEMVINQEAGSVKISQGSELLSTDDNTAYIQPMTVQVTDGAGNAVAGQTVTLRIWPKLFSTGYWTADPCKPVLTADFGNEDLDRDLNKDSNEDRPIHEHRASVDLDGDGIVDTMTALDANEDLFIDGIDIDDDGLDDAVSTDGNGLFYMDVDSDGVVDTIVAGSYLVSSLDGGETFLASLNGDLDWTDSYDDGKLTPAGADAGSVPAVVTTNEFGLAPFNLTYAKNSAVWIVDEITATTQVSGSETRGTLIMRLPYADDDECELSHSPFNPTTVQVQ